MNTTPNENNENMENENVAEVEIEETAETVLEEEIVAAEEVTEEVTEEVSEVIVAEETEEALEETAEETEISAIEGVFDSEEAPKKNNKLFAFTGLVALIVVCAFLWVMYSGIFAPKYAPTYDNSDIAGYYMKDETIKGRKDNGEVYTVIKDSFKTAPADGQISVADFIQQTTIRSADGEAIVYYKNFDLEGFVGDLFVRYKDKDEIKIDSNVAYGGTMISPNGKTVIYAKTVLAEDGMSIQNLEFYLYRKGKAPVLINNNVSLRISPALSQTGAYFAYCTDNPETQATELYVVRTTDRTLKPKKIAAQNVSEILAVKDNGYVFYNDGVASEGGGVETTISVYYASAKKAPVKVADNASIRPDWIGQQTNNFAYCLINEDTDSEFYFGGIGKKTQKRYTAGKFIAGADVENKNAYFFNVDAEDESKYEITAMYGKKMVYIGNEINVNAYFVHSRDFRKMAYIKNFNQESFSADLYYTDVKFGKANSKLVSKNVFNVIESEDLKYLAYFSNIAPQSYSSPLSIFDGKKSKKVADNVFLKNVCFADNNTKIYYLTDCTLDSKTGLVTGTLNMSSTRNPGKAKIIDKDVTLHLTAGIGYTVRDDGSIYYMKNINTETQTGDLYFAKKGKTGTLVEKDVSSLIFE